MRSKENEFRQFIESSGLVPHKDLRAAEEESRLKGIPLGDVLVAEGKLSPDDLRGIRARALGLQFVDLKDMEIDFAALSMIPEPLVRKHNAVAFRKTPDSLEVALLNIDDLESIAFIRETTDRRILPRLTDTGSIKSALLQYQRHLKSQFGDVIRKETETIRKFFDVVPQSAVSRLEKFAEELPVVRIIDALLKHAIVQSASDIHLEPTERELIVRYRVAGLMHDAMILPKEAHIPIAARIKLLSSLAIEERVSLQEGRFKVEMNGEKVSLRVTVSPTFYGEKIVMRLLREGASGISLEHLGFHGPALEKVHDAMKGGGGVIVVTGPAQAGKSDALYALVEIMNHPGVTISTVERNIQKMIPRVNQVHVRPDIGFSYEDAFRAAVRHDADIIMASDINDEISAGLALNTALLGRLVLTSTESATAAGSVSYFLDMGLDRDLIASSLSLVVGRRVVRTLSKDALRRPLSKSELKALEKIVDLDRMLLLLRSENVIGPADGWDKVLFGIAHDKNTDKAYSGTTGIHEVMNISPAVKTIIRKGGKSGDIEACARKEGMVTLLEDGIFLAAKGVTTIEEVLKAVTR